MANVKIYNMIKAIIVLQIDGRRALVRYYDDTVDQKRLERSLYAKTKTPKGKDDIIKLDGHLIVHKFVTDSHIYVVGRRTENPIILDSVLDCIVEVIKSLPGNTSGNNTVMENLSRVMLALDDIYDLGILLENDSSLVEERITSSNHEETVESMAQRTARRFFGI